MNREVLARDFEGAELPWKTYLVEAHSEGDTPAFIDSLFGSHARETEDASLTQVKLPFDNGWVNFTVDHLFDRFWSIHTSDPVAIVRPSLERLIDGHRTLDWVWLPAGHMSELWPGNQRGSLKVVHNETGLLDPESGENFSISFRSSSKRAEHLRKQLQKDYASVVSPHCIGAEIHDDSYGGTVNEALTRKGQFVATGSSFALHQAVVGRVRKKYADLVGAIEEYRMCWNPLETGSGGTFSGGAIELKFSKKIPDLEKFTDRLFSSKAPFRLWGIPVAAGDDLFEVDAVDLHVGHVLRLDVSSEWLRVVLLQNTCGNTIARLVSNLQRHFDAGLEVTDPFLAAKFIRKSEVR